MHRVPFAYTVDGSLLANTTDFPLANDGTACHLSTYLNK